MTGVQTCALPISKGGRYTLVELDRCIGRLRSNLGYSHSNLEGEDLLYKSLVEDGNESTFQVVDDCLVPACLTFREERGKIDEDGIILLDASGKGYAIIKPIELPEGGRSYEPPEGDSYNTDVKVVMCPDTLLAKIYFEDDQRVPLNVLEVGERRAIKDIAKNLGDDRIGWRLLDVADTACHVAYHPPLDGIIYYNLLESRLQSLFHFDTILHLVNQAELTRELSITPSVAGLRGRLSTIEGLKENFGGTAGNIAYNLAALKEQPVILATAGNDFENYREWLERSGVDISQIKIINEKHTNPSEEETVNKMQVTDT